MPDTFQCTVKWFSNQKGYGFLIPPNDVKKKTIKGDIFFHITSIFNDDDKPCIKEGVVVDCELFLSKNGKFQAHNVRESDTARIEREKAENVQRQEEEEQRHAKDMEEQRKSTERQLEMDTMVSNKIETFQWKHFIQYDATKRFYSIYTPNYGDYRPTLLYDSGHYMTCDLCKATSKFRTNYNGFHPPVIKQKTVTKQGWLFSYQDTEYILTDGHRYKVMEPSEIRKKSSLGYVVGDCIHRKAKLG